MSIRIEVSQTFDVEVDEELWDKFDGNTAVKVAAVVDNLRTFEGSPAVRVLSADIGDWEASRDMDIIGCGSGSIEDV